MELIKHELNKIFSNKSLWIVIGIFIFVNVLSFSVQLYYNKIDKNILRSYVREVEGPITDEKVAKADRLIKNLDNSNVSNAGQAAREEMFKNELYSRLYQKYASYENNRANIDMARVHMSDTTGFDLRSNTLYCNALTRVNSKEYYYPGGWNYSIGYTYSLGAAMMAVLILLGLSAMFSGEYSSKMDSIILSSKYGKTKLIRAKIAASVVFIITIDLTMNIYNLLTNLIAYGGHGWDVPMQCLNDYMFSPYNFTVLQYYLIQLLIHIGACIAFGLFVMLISSLCKSQVLTFFICTVVFVLPFMIDKIMALKSPLAELITRFSYTWFMQVEKMFSSFKVYDILDHPVFYPAIGIIIMVLLMPFCCYYMGKNFKNHSIGV